MKKTKIINDPVYGFININEPLLLDILDHPWVQRLRRIKQLGKTGLVYPGAQHTRLQHSLGAMHLMQLAIETLRSKDCEISDDEALAAKIAMLLHDIGHGPFSHVLEHSIVENISHEEITLILMERMNEYFGGQMQQSIDTYRGKCRPFLHQLISSQLDTDRLDYLKRDSFFTGVVEGTVGSDRIIKMLNVHNESLVVESKGIYSIEKFLIARRLMYWQVYLHKTVVAAEKMLIEIVRRAKFLSMNGKIKTLTSLANDLFAPPQLAHFLKNKIDLESFNTDETINYFCDLDDSDIMSSIKVWAGCDDKVLSVLSRNFLDRKLFKIEITTDDLDENRIVDIRKRVSEKYGISYEESDYFVVSGQISSKTYTLGDDRINIMFSPDNIKDISETSAMLNLSELGKSDRRNFICYPKVIL